MFGMSLGRTMSDLARQMPQQHQPQPHRMQAGIPIKQVATGPQTTYQGPPAQQQMPQQMMQPQDGPSARLMMEPQDGPSVQLMPQTMSGLAGGTSGLGQVFNQALGGSKGQTLGQPVQHFAPSPIPSANNTLGQGMNTWMQLQNRMMRGW